jgi:hypothetical protein
MFPPSTAQTVAGDCKPGQPDGTRLFKPVHYHRGGNIPAETRMVEIRIDRIEPFASGMAFGAAGAYERVIGVATGALDPADSRNAGIAGLDRAPRNPEGRVDYEADLFLLRPVDPARGNRRLLFEVLNRGSKLAIHMLNQLPAPETGAINDPILPEHAGDGLVFRLGYTLAWTGWDPDAPAKSGGMTARIPALAGVEQEVRDEFVSNARGPALERFRLSYAPADQVSTRLTMRYRERDEPREIPRAAWRFIDPRSVELIGARPEPGIIYELTYRARTPWVSGIGFAITRDVAAFLRSGPAESPARNIEAAFGFGISQSGRYLRDFIRQGFNQSLAGEKVFDGVLTHTAGAGGVFLNALFAQPFRTRTQHQDHTMPEVAFPFSTARTRDPASGVEASLLRGDGFDPLLIESNTSSEYWQKGASLLSTNPDGTHDLDLPHTARQFLVSGTQHGGRAGTPSSQGNCRNARNPHSAAPAVRALLVALDRWVTEGKKPADSRIPRLSDGTLVEAAKLDFPPLPDFAIAKEANSVGPRYRPLVPTVDADGNERAGLRLPDIAVPVATFTGWNVYAPPFPPDALCDRDGSFLPIARSDAARAANDPRVSLVVRYGSHDRYVALVRAAADALVDHGLLLAEDADAYVSAAQVLRF